MEQETEQRATRDKLISIEKRCAQLNDEVERLKADKLSAQRAMTLHRDEVLSDNIIFTSIYKFFVQKLKVANATIRCNCSPFLLLRIIFS